MGAHAGQWADSPLTVPFPVCSCLDTQPQCSSLCHCHLTVAVLPSRKVVCHISVCCFCLLSCLLMLSLVRKKNADMHFILKLFFFFNI